MNTKRFTYNDLALKMPREALQKSHIQKTAFYTQTITETDTYHKNFTSKFSVYYSPYGTLLDGRHGNETSYRYGYQGSEKDDELKGSGNSYTTHFRLLDPRIGRWFTIDPILDASSSPYTSMDNNPVMLNDKLGNWTEERAKKVAAKARRKGADVADVTHEEGGGSRDYGVHIEKNYRGHRYYGDIGGNGKISSEDKLHNLKWLSNSRNPGFKLGAHMKMDAAYEAEKAREYRNSHGLLRNFDFNYGIGGLNARAFSDGNVSAEIWKQWLHNRANVQAVDDFAYGLLKYTTYGVAGGVIFFEAAGSEGVSTVVRYGWRYGSKLYGGVKTSVSWYHNNFGKHGGYKSFIDEVANQTGGQLYKNQGSVNPSEYSAFGLGTSLFVRDKDVIVAYTQNVVCSHFSIGFNGEIDGAWNKGASYNAKTTVNAIITEASGSVVGNYFFGLVQGALDYHEERRK